MDEYEKTLQEHRVIGIMHSLKAFKDDGLIDDDTMYPDDAVDEIKDEMLKIARKWYKLGAKRGSLETLNAFLEGKFQIGKSKKGKVEIIANVDRLTWSRRLNVTVGGEKKHIDSCTYKLKIKEDLEFE